MQLPVTLRLKSSPTLVVALVVAHGLVASGAVAMAAAPVLMFPVLMLLTLSLAFHLWRHVWRPPLLTLTLKADGQLEVVERRDGRCGAAQIHSQTTVFPWLITLLLKIEGRAIALALPPDALEREGHRQLRLWLRWKASAATA